MMYGMMKYYIYAIIMHKSSHMNNTLII